jgi:hypothetical protein
MAWECFKVLRLEVSHDSDWELGLAGEGWGLAAVVTSVAKLFTHEAVSVMAVVRAQPALSARRFSGPSSSGQQILATAV